MFTDNNPNLYPVISQVANSAAMNIAQSLREGTDISGLEEELYTEIETRLQTQLEKDALLRKLQLAELDILVDFDAFCRKHNLRYYVVGGTLIGAVRHKGFIPWDDDIDVSMPREDFDKMMKSLPKELSDKYFLQNQKTEKGCYFYYAKLRKNGTYFGESKFEHTALHKGIFIDIFPLDYIYDNSFLQKLTFKTFTCLGLLVCSKKKTSETLYNNSKIRTILFFKFLQAILPCKFLLWFRRMVGKCAHKLSKKNLRCSLNGFHGYPMEIAPDKWWGEGVDIEFEGHSFRAPSEYHKLLTHMFGDYMELPPVNKRKAHVVASESIIFSGVSNDDYKPKFKRKYSRRYKITKYKIIKLNAHEKTDKSQK